MAAAMQSRHPQPTNPWTKDLLMLARTPRSLVICC